MSNIKGTSNADQDKNTLDNFCQALFKGVKIVDRKYYFCYTIGTDFKKKIQKSESFENIKKSQLLEIAQRVYDNYDSRDKMNKQIKNIPEVKARAMRKEEEKPMPCHKW